jgi:hypothetical protein
MIIQSQRFVELLRNEAKDNSDCVIMIMIMIIIIMIMIIIIISVYY